MSAFTVDLEHINVLVRAGMGFGADRDRVQWVTDAPTDAAGVMTYSANGDTKHRTAVNDAASDIGQMLVSANWRSVNYRYNEDELEPVYEYRAPRVIDREPVEILKAIGCLRYQSCEFPEWATCEAARYLDALEGAMIHRLPGMSDAAWEIDRGTLSLLERRRATLVAKRDGVTR